MAGICTGPGLTTVDGLLALDGARSVAWPDDAGHCVIGASNGLRVDPVSGAAWVPPDPVFSDLEGTQSGGVDRHVAVASAASIALSKLSLTMTARACGRSLFRGEISGGYQGWRAATGNFWLLQRFVTISVDGAPIAFTGSQPVGGIENNSGGVLSAAAPVEALPIYVQLTSGQKIDVLAEYSLDPQTFSANAVNGLAWRAPKLHGVLFTYPE